MEKPHDRRYRGAHLRPTDGHAALRVAQSGARGTAQIALWIGALVGTAAVAMALVSVLMGMRPLVFQSGSMAPAYETGDLGFAAEVSSDALAVGDVVTVVDANGVRVTHRIVEIEHFDEHAVLRLKGDANQAADPLTVAVSSADRVIFRVPKAGLAIEWLMSPPGMLVAGVLVGTLVFVGFVLPSRMVARPRRSHPRRRRARAAALAGVVALVATTAATPPPDPTLAYWTDRASAATGAFTAYTVPPPTVAGTPCSTSGVLPPNGTITLRWNGISARPAGAPVLGQHEYVVRIINRNTGAQIRQDLQTHAGAASSVQQRSMTGGLLAGLGLGSTPAQAQIQTRVIGTNWVSSQTVTINFTINTTLTIVSFSCG